MLALASTTAAAKCSMKVRMLKEKMKFNVSDLMLMNGDTDDDQRVAAQFCRDALAEVKQRADLIEAIWGLDHILDRSVMGRATDAYAGILHIAAAANALAEFHKAGKLNAVISVFVMDLLFVGQKAEETYKLLRSCWPDAIYQP